METNVPHSLPPMRFNLQSMETLYRVQQYAAKHTQNEITNIPITQMHIPAKGNRKHNE